MLTKKPIANHSNPVESICLNDTRSVNPDNSLIVPEPVVPARGYIETVAQIDFFFGVRKQL